VSDFPTLRRIVAGFDPWIAALASPHLPFRKVPAAAGSYFWRFRDENAHALLVGKAVRIVTSLRGALLCADHRLNTEALSLLRMVSDFADEMIAVGEGLLESRLTTAQTKFVEQYFTSVAETAEEHAERGFERYVSREELFKAQRRLVEKVKGDVDELLKMTRYVQKGYDSYVHGAYETSMELFRGDEMRFMLSGHDSPRYLCLTYTSLAAKLVPVLVAFEFAAVLHGLDDLRKEIIGAREALVDSGEGLSAKCADTPSIRAAV
jgi:hypothetical protein